MTGNALTHRDPSEYDLPIDDWICKACAAEILGVARGHIDKVRADYEIESAHARPIETVNGRRDLVAFYLRSDVTRAVRDRLLDEDVRTTARTNSVSRLGL